MNNPAITVIFRQDGTSEQTAGFDIPVETQVETLTEAGRLNRPLLPGATRGEVWTRGRVVTTSFFDPDEDASAQAKRKASEEGAAEAAAAETAAAEAAPEISGTSAPSPTSVSGKKKSS